MSKSTLQRMLDKEKANLQSIKLSYSKKFKDCDEISKINKDELAYFYNENERIKDSLQKEKDNETYYTNLLTKIRIDIDEYTDKFNELKRNKENKFQSTIEINVYNRNVNNLQIYLNKINKINNDIHNDNEQKLILKD